MALNEFDSAEIPLKWSTGDIKCLIDLYAQHSHEFDSFQKNKVWDILSKELSQIRCKKITAEQCNGKWKGLKSTYKKIKDRGKDSKHWEHFDAIHELLYKQPEMNLSATCSNDCPEVITNDEITYDFSDGITEESNDRKENIIKVRKRQADSDVRTAHQLKQKETMETTDQNLALFKTLATAERVVEQMANVIEMQKNEVAKPKHHYLLAHLGSIMEQLPDTTVNNLAAKFIAMAYGALEKTNQSLS